MKIFKQNVFKHLCFIDIKMKVKDFLVLSFLLIIFVNLSFINAFLVFLNYGSVTLNPGESYIVNIPFINLDGEDESINSSICGRTETNNGEIVEGVVVSVYYSDNLIGESVTNSSGNYCIFLPEINSARKYDIFIEYDNKTQSGDFIKLASNDYLFNVENDLIFKKSDGYVVLSGDIDNGDADIDNGRIEVNLQYWSDNSSDRYTVFDYRKYFVNLNSQENYEFPNDEFNLTWEIPDNAKLGQYKYYIKTSFNAKEKAKSVYFYLIE